MSRVEHPLIAINGELSSDPSPRLSLANRYADAVLKAGGIPVAVPPVGGPADIRRLLEAVDGLLLSGGDDFDMRRLGKGETHPAARPVRGEKQDFDVALAEQALARELPVLGVCYGMQLLALVDGGELHQHLPDDRPAARDHRGGVLHPVEVVEASKLAAILEATRLEVVSRHHQAVAHVGAGWRICARDDQGLIEAIEHREHPFALGVQWHPEQAEEGSPQDRLFRALIGAAGVAAGRRLYSAGARPLERR